MFLLQHYNWPLSVHQQAYLIGPHCIMWCDIWITIQVSNSFIGVGTIMDWMVLLILIGESVSHVGLQQDCWHDTTNLSCCGGQECRKRLRCQLRKQNIDQHLKLQLRSYIFATWYETWAYHKRMIHPCMRITACMEWGNHIIGGRERAKHVDIRKHFAHEIIKNCYPFWSLISNGPRAVKHEVLRLISKMQVAWEVGCCRLNKDLFNN